MYGGVCVLILLISRKACEGKAHSSTTCTCKRNRVGRTFGPSSSEY
jgi:hypothetical protein